MYIIDDRFIFVSSMQYTVANATQIAEQTWLSVYADYAFLVGFVQGWSKKSSLAKKRVRRTNDLFAGFHTNFVDTMIQKQYRARVSLDADNQDMSKVLCDDELDIRLQNV